MWQDIRGHAKREPGRIPEPEGGYHFFLVWQDGLASGLLYCLMMFDDSSAIITV